MEPIKLVKDTIDKADIAALCEWLSQDETPRLTKGELTLHYEIAYAAKCDRKYGVFVSSGSNANLLAVYALVASGAMRNNIVIAPALSWATTVAPLVQFGLKPVLCDINAEDLSVEMNFLEELFVKHQPAVFFLVSVLGMPPQKMTEIVDLCWKYGVILIMDNCESQNSKIHGRPLEKYGLMSTCSSYMGHITSTIEGGMITTDSTKLYHLLLMLRSHGWDRDLPEKEKLALQMQWKVDDFNRLYTFYEAGFNVRSTEINAFLGLRQLKKLDYFTINRDNNFWHYDQLIINSHWKPDIAKVCMVSNLGYPVIHPKRDAIIKELIKNEVECRPLISGSMSNQPFFKKSQGDQRMPLAEHVQEAGLYIPNHPFLTKAEIRFISDIINHFTDAD